MQRCSFVALCRSFTAWMVYLWDGGKRERAERYPWDQVCFSHPSFSIIHQALLKRCFIDFLMRGGAMAFQGVSLSLFASLELSVCFAVLLYNHNKKSFSLYGCRFLFFCEKELCLIGAKNKLPDKLFHVCWRGVRGEREREQGKGKERSSTWIGSITNTQEHSAWGSRRKKDSLEGKEMERGAEREGVTEEIDAVFAVCWFTVISVSQVQRLWVLPCFTPLSSPLLLPLLERNSLFLSFHLKYFTYYIAKASIWKRGRKIWKIK